MQYTISYSSEPKRLNQNVPFDSYLAQGQFQYFNFYFDNSTENIYIGLTNMNGDADMYLNRGTELPSMEKSHWRATDTNHEYIEISKDDPYFKTHKKPISGYYTLLLIGFVDTSYSLFISSHKNKVFPLRDNIVSTCIMMYLIGIIKRTALSIMKLSLHQNIYMVVVLCSVKTI